VSARVSECVRENCTIFARRFVVTGSSSAAWPVVDCKARGTKQKRERERKPASERARGRGLWLVQPSCASSTRPVACRPSAFNLHCEADLRFLAVAVIASLSFWFLPTHNKANNSNDTNHHHSTTTTRTTAATATTPPPPPPTTTATATTTTTTTTKTKPGRGKRLQAGAAGRPDHAAGPVRRAASAGDVDTAQRRPQGRAGRQSAGGRVRSLCCVLCVCSCAVLCACARASVGGACVCVLRAKLSLPARACARARV
jgi:hypothetical protein